MKKLVVGMAVAILGLASFAGVRHVVPQGTAGNTPTPPYDSWATAANDVATALDGAAANDTILVAGGTYDVSAQIIISTANLTLRSWDPATDQPAPGAAILVSAEEASPSQLMLASSASGTVLDGFVFRNARGRGAFLNKSPASQILNCSFEGNVSAEGAGLRLYDSANSVVSNCVFTSNNASADGTERLGGGLYSGGDNDAPCTVVDCAFADNTAQLGGGLYAGRKINIARCFFKDNDALSAKQYTASGANVYMSAASSVLRDSTFTGVSSCEYGLAAYVNGSSSVISNCSFAGLNPKKADYGIVMVRSGCTIDGCMFTNNVNLADAIMAYATPVTSTLNVRNCLFADNANQSSILRGHAAKGPVHFENCTVVATGKRLVNYSGVPCTNDWVNCILLGNLPDAKTGYLNIVTNCRTDDPKFVAPEVRDYRLSSSSPCIDAGIERAWCANAVDIRGLPRVVGAAVDIGCYERQTDDTDFSDIRRVVADEADRTGEWADAYTNIQDAVDAALDYGLVLVRSGNYEIASQITVSNRVLTLMSRNPETGKPDRDGTVLDGKGANRILFTHWGATMASDTTYDERVPAVQHPVRIEGFTFANGRTADGDGQCFAGNGGGLLMFGRAKEKGLRPSTVVNCRFTNCTAVNGGGAAFCGGFFEDCLFDGNVASTTGGGAACIAAVSSRGRLTKQDISCTWYSPGFAGCVFSNNQATTRGGGLAVALTASALTAYIVNCEFVDNKMAEAGKGSGSAMTGVCGGIVSNCVYRGNSGSAYGVISSGAEAMTFSDLLFSGNSASYGMIYSEYQNGVYERLRIVDNAGPGFMGYGKLVQCLIANTAGSYCVRCWGQNKTLSCESCTFYSPTAAVLQFKGTYEPGSFSVNMTDCILFRNGGATSLFDSVSDVSSAYLTNCCLSATLDPSTCPPERFVTVDPVIGNPRFADAANGDWSLRRTSCCRDKGRLLPWMDAAATDFAGNPRVVTDGQPLAVCPTALPDIGCYEIQEAMPGMLLLVQ